MQDRRKDERQALSESWLGSQQDAGFLKILETGGSLPPVPPGVINMQQYAQAVDERNADPLLALSTVAPPIAALSTSADQASLSSSPDLETPVDALCLPRKSNKRQKRQARNEASRGVEAECLRNSSKLYDIYTGKPAPVGASQSKQYITFNAYVKRQVECNKITTTTYVHTKTGEPAPGITKETHHLRQHITLYTWLVRQKNKEFVKILSKAGDLPPLGNKQQERQAASDAQRRASAKTRGRWQSKKLYDSYTGKPAPEGASKSEQYITFCAYVRRHVEETNKATTTYVNIKTGKPAPGITKKTHQRGKHTILHTWLLSQKNAEFLKIIKEGRDLPPAFPRKRKMREKAQAAAKQKAGLLPAHSNFVPPRAEASAEASNVSADPHSPLATSGHAAIKSIGLTEVDLAYDHSFLDPATPSTFPDEISSDDAFDASVHGDSSPTAFFTDQATVLLSPGLEKSVDDMLAPESFFATETDTGELASPTEAGLPVHTVTAVGEQVLFLSAEPAEKPVETDFNCYFSEPVASPAFSLLPTTPFDAYAAEVSGAATPSHLDPAISAEQDAFEQDRTRKRRPNPHTFFKSHENDCGGHASKQAKTTSFDGSAEYPLTAADMPESTSGVSLMLSKRTVPF